MIERETPMNNTKATYWIALATFALMLNSEYQHGKSSALSTIANRAESIVCGVSTGAERTVAVAEFLTSRSAMRGQRGMCKSQSTRNWTLRTTTKQLVNR
jgi:hypothetical protein